MPDVLGTQRCLIHNLCLERNQDLVPLWVDNFISHERVVEASIRAKSKNRFKSCLYNMRGLSDVPGLIKTEEI